MLNKILLFFKAQLEKILFFKKNKSLSNMQQSLKLANFKMTFKIFKIMT
jgi:hypothetical protein